MKKLFFTLVLSVCFFTSAFGVSWSGLVDNNSKISSNNDFSTFLLRQSNGIYLSVKIPVSKKGNILFSAEGLYKYNLDYNFKTNTKSFKNIADCDFLNLTGSWKINNGTFKFNAGRFLVSDFSANAFTQISDGVLLSYSNSKIAANIYGGYTGLLNRLNVSMADNVSESKDDFYRFCPQYVPVIADISYKTLFKKHTIGLQGEMFIPVSDKLQSKTYFTLLLKGPVNRFCNYKASFTLGTIKFEKYMFDAIADINFFVIPSGMLTAGVEYTSSKKDSIINFAPVTSRSLVNDPYFTGGILPKIAFMYSKNLFYASLTGKGVIAIADESKFRGIDATFDLVYNIFNDLQVGCNVTAFFGIEDAAKASNYSATAKVKVAF